MYEIKNENSFKKNIYETNKLNSNNLSLFNLKLIHRIFNSLNISLLILIFILTFLSFNSQRKWTIIYKNLTPDDLIYLVQKITKKKNNNLNKKIKNMHDGLRDSKYQKGY